MRNRLAVICVLYSIKGITQSPPIVCTSEQDQKKNILIYANNRTIGTYTVALSFPILEGLEPNTDKDQFFEAPSGKSTLMKLSPKPGVTPDLQFGFKSYEGKCFSKAPENSMTYLLPAMPGNTVTYLESQQIAERIGKEPPKGYQAYYFQLKPGDTICASRSGVVTKINEEIRQGISLNTTFPANRNQIKLEHKDGTIALYTFVAPILSFVDIGKEIKAGEPIAALVQKSEKSDKYGVFFSVFYLDEAKISTALRQQTNLPKYFYTYLPLNFYLTNKAALEFSQTYTIEHPREILNAEVSKKDKK